MLILAVAVMAGDRDDVEAVALAYIDSIYHAEPAKVAEIAHPELAKRGFYWEREGVMHEAKMDFAGLQRVATNWNKSKSKDLTKLARKVEIYEVLDQTASVKVTADWGSDYMLLAKYDGKWKVVQVLWQARPPKQ